MASAPQDCLRAELDKIATALLLANTEAVSEELRQSCLSSLDEIQRAAKAAGATHIEEISTELLCALNAGPVSSAALSEAVSAMQQQVEARDSPQTPAEQPAPVMDIAHDPELLAEFVVEAREHLASVESLALALEKDCTNQEAIHALFRSFHSIKGLAAFLELPRIQRFSHEMETLLDLARNNRLTITSEAIDLILTSKDFLGRCVGAVESETVAEVPEDDVPIVERIRRMVATSGTEEPAAKPPEVAEASAAAELLPEAGPQPRAAEAPVEAKPAPDPRK